MSNDDAVLLVMGRHILKGELATILWNQPYNGALDAYLLAPGLLVAGHHLVFRLYELACAALLVLLVFLLARSVGGAAAGFAGALLAAWGTPYMALMTATGPPPNFLMPLVTGFPLVAGLRSLEPGAPPLRPIALFGVGALCGVAVWNSSLAIPAFTGMMAGLLLAGLQPRLSTVWLLLGFAVGVSPLAVARLIHASGAPVETAASAVTALRPRWLWASGIQDLGSALSRLVGLEVPLVVDGPEHQVLPVAARVAVAAGLGAALGLAVWSRRALPLLGWAAALAGAFALSRRTGPDDLRYLYGLNAPLLALAGVGVARAWSWRRPAGVLLAAALLLPWGLGDRVLTARWRDPGHAVRVWQVPPIDAPVQALEREGVRSAYASLQFATRLTLESRERVVASQACNERIPGDPLRFRDEVDLDPRPAWVLHPALSRGMPRAAGFREQLRGMGGTWHEEPAGDFVIFRNFVPPFRESQPVPVAEITARTIGGEPLGSAVLDRDPATAWTAREGLGKGSGIVVGSARARRLGALVLLVNLERSPAGRAVDRVDRERGRGERPGPAGNAVGERGAACGEAGPARRPPGRPNRERGAPRLPGTGPAALDRRALPVRTGRSRTARRGRRRGRPAPSKRRRRGDWSAAERDYREAIRLEPDRASHHAAWARAHWRAPRRRWLDVESLDDGGPDLVTVR